MTCKPSAARPAAIDPVAAPPAKAHMTTLHFGMVIVGLPYSHAGQMTLEEIVGGAPYGATTIAGGKGERQVSKLELDGARHQGALIANTAAKLAA